MSRTTKPSLASILEQGITETGFDPNLVPEFYESIATSGLQRRSWWLAFCAASFLHDERPCTLRGLFYRVVSAGILPSTDKANYQQLGRVMTTLREAGAIPFDWLVDNVRSTLKPSSWAGIDDFAETVRDCYRLDFWRRLPDYVHVVCEKDAIAGVLSPVCREYDIRLSPIRGYVSLSFAHEIADVWNRTSKPVAAYYLGDYDPSGFDLERDIVDKLTRYCSRPFSWTRLGVNEPDFAEFDLVELEPKESDRRTRKFIEQHGDRCAEIDAIPATELRRRLRSAIESHIPPGEWERLQEVETAERSSWSAFVDQFQNGGSHD